MALSPVWRWMLFRCSVHRRVAFLRFGNCTIHSWQVGDMPMNMLIQKARILKLSSDLLRLCLRSKMIAIIHNGSSSA